MTTFRENGGQEKRLCLIFGARNIIEVHSIKIGPTNLYQNVNSMTTRSFMFFCVTVLFSTEF